MTAKWENVGIRELCNSIRELSNSFKDQLNKNSYSIGEFSPKLN